MADEKPPAFVSINDIDISKYVQDVTIKEPDDAYLLGIKRIGPFTLSGRWDDGTVICAGCGIRFTPATSTPTGKVSINDVDLGWACDRCALAALAATDAGPSA